MGVPTRRLLALLLLLGALTGTGCNIATLAYFLLPESKFPPRCGQIASDDKKKEVKALVLVLGQDLETRPETMQVDRQLAELLVKRLRDKYQANEENVTLIQPRKIDDYKSKHPEWKTMDPRQIGQDFKVDYIIVLEITQFELYEKARQMYQGQANISLTLVDVKKPDETPAIKEFTCVYPSVPIDKDDHLPAEFRLRFLNNIAKKLTLQFAAHSSREEHEMEDELAN
jgi:hypothetical protein